MLIKHRAAELGTVIGAIWVGYFLRSGPNTPQPSVASGEVSAAPAATGPPGSHGRSQPPSPTLRGRRCGSDAIPSLRGPLVSTSEEVR
jgi:hypothetical protein